MENVRGPNPIAVAWSMLLALRSQHPHPTGSATVDHSALRPTLTQLQRHGTPALPDLRDELARYRRQLEDVAPDTLSRDEALAYWLNLYNAGALDLAAASTIAQSPSVLRVPGGFRRPWATVAGETLSLDAIEHGKIRRFGDPRIHGGLVCGSASCPTLRYEPYGGAALDAQLDDQLRSFLTAGGAVADRREGVLRLSRVFLWYGADFVRPQRMPTWVPASKRRIAAAVAPWLDEATAAWLQAERPSIEFQPYDWSLACAVG